MLSAMRLVQVAFVVLAAEGLEGAATVCGLVDGCAGEAEVAGVGQRIAHFGRSDATKHGLTFLNADLGGHLHPNLSHLVLGRWLLVVVAIHLHRSVHSP